MQYILFVFTLLLVLFVIWKGDDFFMLAIISAEVGVVMFYFIDHPTQRAIDRGNLEQRAIAMYALCVGAMVVSFCSIGLGIRERQLLKAKAAKK